MNYNYAREREIKAIYKMLRNKGLNPSDYRDVILACQHKYKVDNMSSYQYRANGSFTTNV